ncbi:MAG: class I SAM-dependent methyltransferase [Planctomycetota bacterium]|jgi:SAM-dependent methyltransferase
MPEQNWDERYRTGDLPWDTGTHAEQLERALGALGIEPCAALEVGCGTGTNAVWLAGRGFTVTAVDVSETAVERAREKAEDAGVEVTFLAADFVRGPGAGADLMPGAPFGFAFDRGCLHSFEDLAERTAFAEAVARNLAPGGLWLSLIGSTDAPPRDVGPPRLSAVDVATTVERSFEILSLSATSFQPDVPDSPPAWECVMRKRG